MNSFEEQISKHYKWTLDYSNKVIFEYERFLTLKSTESKVIPSNDIDKLWRYHIYNVNNYTNYCVNKFKKIINYNLEKNIEEDKNNFYATINYYKMTFGEFKYPEVWNYTLSITINEVNTILNAPKQQHYQQINNENSIWKIPNQVTYQQTYQQTNQQINIPSYVENKPNQGEFKVFIYFKNVMNGYESYDKKIIPYISSNQFETIDMFKDLVSKTININKNIFNISLHPNILINALDKFTYLLNNYLKSNILLKDLLNKGYNFFIIEINN